VEETLHCCFENGTTGASVDAGDIDGDGDTDVVYTIGPRDKGIGWFENVDGRGQLRFAGRIGNFAIATSSQLADIDGDTDLDLVYNRELDWYLGWFENMDGKGTFGPAQVFGRDSVRRFLVADVDSDNDPDVVALDYRSLVWYENTDGRGTFGTKKVASHGIGGAIAVAAADFDSDGDLDLLTGSLKGYFFGDSEPGKIVWYENLDHGSAFLSHLIMEFQSSSVVAADLDQDGDADVAASSQNNNSVVVLSNADGKGTFSIASRTNTLSDSELVALQASDMDLDGDLDLIARSGNEERIDWFENSATIEDFRVVHTVTNGDAGSSNSGWGIRSIATTDIDLDGDVDVLSGSPNHGAILLYRQWDRIPGDANGDGSFDTQDIVQVAQAGKYEEKDVAHATYEEGDWDGDGDFDTSDLVFAFAAGCYQLPGGQGRA
jgi:hypothetical protein